MGGGRGGTIKIKIETFENLVSILILIWTLFLNSSLDIEIGMKTFRIGVYILRQISILLGLQSCN